MERTKRPGKTTAAAKTADAILVSDLHLTESAPVSRTDNYWEAQKEKLRFLAGLSKKNGGCPILCAGDIFDYWKASPWLCAEIFCRLPHPFVGIPGQHDLPAHSLDNYHRSALSLLEVAETAAGRRFHILKGGTVVLTGGFPFSVTGIPYGKVEECLSKGIPRLPTEGRRILLLHELTWPGRRPAWSESGYTDRELLEMFGERFDLIVTGDNHAGFLTRRKGSLLVNPGSMMRITADQADYTPHCYLYYAEDNAVKPVPFPIKENVHNREHLDRKNEREERIAAYIERMNENWEIGLSFRKNLEAFFAENKTPRKIRELIWEHFEEEKGREAR